MHRCSKEVQKRIDGRPDVLLLRYVSAGRRGHDNLNWKCSSFLASAALKLRVMIPAVEKQEIVGCCRATLFQLVPVIM